MLVASLILVSTSAITIIVMILVDTVCCQYYGWCQLLQAEVSSPDSFEMKAGLLGMQGHGSMARKLWFAGNNVGTGVVPGFYFLSPNFFAFTTS